VTRGRIPGGVLAAALVLGGCATFSPDGGMGEVRQLAEARVGTSAQALNITGDPEAARNATQSLLQAPLSADGAVELALLNNAGLKAQLANLGLAEADLVQAGRLRNPVFAYSNKRNSDVVTIDRTVMVNVAALVFMPLALDIQQRHFEQAKVAAAANIVATAAATRVAFYRAVAAQEMLTYFTQVKVSAEASSELARRMAQVGNFNRLAQMREQAFYAEATAQLARAQRNALSQREQLTRMLGLPSGVTFVLPERLPGLPAAPFDPGDVEQTAMDRRLDVQVAKLDAESTAKALGLIKATRFINVLDVGYTNESETGDRRKNGYEIELELPIFDWGTARVARAEILYRQAMARTAQLALNAQSEVRDAYNAYLTNFDLAKHYRDEIVPLHRRIAEENLLRYNGMLIGVFELLADSRQQVASVNAAIEATRDYWLAETALQLALAGTSPGSPTMASESPSTVSAAPAAGH
jgi:outer membrane protein TolC